MASHAVQHVLLHVMSCSVYYNYLFTFFLKKVSDKIWTHNLWNHLFYKYKKN